VKLLLDENLSDRVISRILDLHPGSAHVKSLGLIHSSDADIWSLAQQQGYTIVSKETLTFTSAASFLDILPNSSFSALETARPAA